MLWRQPEAASGGPAAKAGNDEDEGLENMRWKIAASLRGHRDDVLDLCWSPDASALVTGSIENICLLWDVEGRKAQVGDLFSLGAEPAVSAPMP